MTGIDIQVFTTQAADIQSLGASITSGLRKLARDGWLYRSHSTSVASNDAGHAQMHFATVVVSKEVSLP